MKTTVSLHDFREAFRRYDRLENFGLDGLPVLFEYLVELEDDLGEELELDVIALCCDYQRFESIEEFNEAYSTTCETLGDVADSTEGGPVLAIGDSGAFITQAF